MKTVNEALKLNRKLSPDEAMKLSDLQIRFDEKFNRDLGNSIFMGCSHRVIMFELLRGCLDKQRVLNAIHNSVGTAKNLAEVLSKFKEELGV